MAEPRGRRGLGRGLSALLGEAERSEPGAALAEIALDAIDPNPDQPRRTVDAAAIEALADSIRASGLVQPVTVRPAGEPGRYELIAGERRWRAARQAGLDRIPALVREADERERLELALIENLVREDLNAIEVARACASLLEDFGQTHAELARRLGRSRPAVSNLVRLLELPPEVQEMVADGRLSEGHARAVLGADGARARRQLAERIAAEGLSVRQAEALARAAAPARAGARRQAPPQELADGALQAFYGAFGAPVRVRPGPRGEVVVELRFASAGDLRAAMERLGS
ncbi:MAG: ParB family transcriptional regulator, chromosome partitioning protein [Miltoncostaeaceae bacterium]|nr:ParB family transcriptional regulator, chromosome partitioning protein [Miltoncostaeaceae bacterium]